MGKFECPIHGIDLRGTWGETWQEELPIGAIRTPALFPLRTGINVRTLRHDDAFRLGHRQRSSAHEACDDGRGCPSLGLKLRSCTPQDPQPHSYRTPQACSSVLRAIGIYFGSTTGHTAEMADAIKDSLGDAGADPVDVGEIDGPAELSDFDALVVGVPTWHTGADSERSGTAWDDFLDEIKQMDSLKGKPVAVFGCGDSVGYGDNFCDAIEEIHDSFAEAGCNMIGYTDPSTYDFGESKSIRDGNFLGLPLDYENEYDECDSRIEKWVLQILEEI